MGSARIRRPEQVDRGPVGVPGAAYAPDASLLVPVWGAILGAKAIGRYDAGVRAAFPGSRVTVLRHVEVGRIRAAEWVFEGVNAGPISLPEGLVSATNRRVSLHGASFLRFSAGRLILEEHRYYDFCSLLEQLGLS